MNLPIITTASTTERYDPPETGRIVVTVYCQDCRTPLRPDDTCPKCDGPPPLDYSPMWKQ